MEKYKIIRKKKIPKKSLKKMLSSKFGSLRILVFNQSSPVHHISRGDGLSVTTRTKDRRQRKVLCLK